MEATPRRVAGWATWATAFICLAWALMRTFGLERGFPLEAVIAWTPFLLPVAVLATLAAGLLRNWSAFGVAVVACVLIAAAVLPRAFGGGHHPASADGPELRVLSANLSLGRADPRELVELAREVDADVLCIQELTPASLAALREEGLDELLPELSGHQAGGSQGSAIFTRHQLTNLESVEPSGYPFVMPSVLLRVGGATPIEVVSVHPVPPTGGRAVTDWRAGLEALPDTSAPGRPILLIGDFNATIDHRELREVLDRGYVDAGDATGGGLTPTWPERLVRPGVTIDHVLADERVAITDYDVHDLAGSDHRAVSATLRLPSARRPSRLAR